MYRRVFALSQFDRHIQINVKTLTNNRQYCQRRSGFIDGLYMYKKMMIASAHVAELCVS